MKKIVLRLITAVIVVFALSALTFGQGGTTGSLAGTITDPQGAVIAGATVVVKNNSPQQSLLHRQTTTGILEFLRLLPAFIPPRLQ